MTLMKLIYGLSLEYDDGEVWSDTLDSINFLLLLFITIMVSPLVLIFDIVFFPIEIGLFLIRKHYENKYNEKYTLEDFIKEDIH